MSDRVLQMTRVSEDVKCVHPYCSIYSKFIHKADIPRVPPITHFRILSCRPDPLTSILIWTRTVLTEWLAVELHRRWISESSSESLSMARNLRKLSPKYRSRVLTQDPGEPIGFLMVDSSRDTVTIRQPLLRPGSL